jgi:PAS domain S-box-containing protein
MDEYLSSYLLADAQSSSSHGASERLDELEAIIASISDGLVIADAEGHLLAMNPAALRMHQYGTVQEARMHLSEYPAHFELHTPEGTVLPVGKWPLAQVLEGERFEGVEVQVHRLDTGHTWIGSYSGTPVFDSKGALKRAVLTIRDITLRKQAEEEARQANVAAHQANVALSKRIAELNAIIESIPDAVYIGTAEGIEWANDDALAQLGYRSVEELNRHIAELCEQIQTRYFNTGKRIPPEDEGFARALRGEQVVRDVVVRHLQSGEDRILRSATAPIRVNGEVTSAVAVNTDITERVRAKGALREAKEQAEAALQSRDEVLAVVSHDLRSLLSTVLLGAAMLQDNTESQVEYGRMIEGAAKQMQRLVEDLLDVARLEAGKALPLQCETVNLSDLLREVYTMFKPRMEEKGVQFDGTFPEGNLYADADPRRILQVLANLVGNALKFTAEGGRVTVRAERRADDVLIAVSDTGAGIAPADQEDIFKPYWQEESTSQAGAGLGLPIARGLIERHGGAIWVDSTPGEGSSFMFTLPLAT